MPRFTLFVLLVACGSTETVSAPVAPPNAASEPSCPAGTERATQGCEPIARPKPPSLPPPTQKREEPDEDEDLSTPGQLALPCKADAHCGLHRCNLKYSRCAFPCQINLDCTGGASCRMGICTP